MKLRSLIVVASTALLVTACNVSEKQIGEAIKKNPKIITDAIRANPTEFIEALNDAVKTAQDAQKKKQAMDEQKKLEDSFNNPLKPLIRDEEVIRGTKGAPITLIEYSDFECPFCQRGYQTVNELLKKYKGKVQFIYKHLPLSFHPNAMPAAKYYEAIRMQSSEKAGLFHDAIFDNFSKVKKGEVFFKSIAKDLKVDMKKLAKDLDSETVKTRIQQDLDEAKKFGFQGTPGFLINGIPVKGAYPASHFEGIINKLIEKGKLKL